MLALGALVVLAVLVAGSSTIALQESRLGQNQLVQARAFAVAEYGLNKIQADWDKTPNLQMKNGESYPTEYTLANQGTAAVKYTRLNNETFWIVSEGQAVVGNTASKSRTAIKRIGAILRLRIPSIKVDAAVTTAGGLDIKGASAISGNNALPTDWDGCDETQPGKPAIVAPPGETVFIQKASAVTSPNGSGTDAVTRDAAAADTMTYGNFGDETWASLYELRNVTITTGSSGAAPDTTNGACDRTVNTNWGEPWRAPKAGVLTACQNYFPIIYSSTTLHLNHGRGQGILLIDGDFKFNGNFEWYGLIIVRGKILKSNGTAKLYGGIMAAHIDTPSDTDDVFNGTIDVYYSQCSLEHAMRGSATVVQAKERAWAELY
ncbi:MAG: hypothetical protein WD801_08820 [Gemmatimonadaceae bacterium]